FTTVGYGDWYPKDRYRMFVMIEGLLGWLTLALFLVTLANVMIRP
ncbi:MAG: two pore domain potassium channel family protein, partial [ANME-2 cluster archaeon]